MPPRDSNLGFLLYYTNLFALISVLAFAISSANNITYIAVVLGILSLIAQDVSWLKACYLAPQDKQLLEKISDLIRERNTSELLWQVDFTNNSISDNDLTSLKVIHSDWIGLDYEFKDRHCQKIWMGLQENIANLLELLGEYSRYHNAYNFSIPDKAAGERANKIAREILASSENLRSIYIRKMSHE